MSVEVAAQDRVKYLLTIKRNERSPSSEIAAHHHRNAHDVERLACASPFTQSWGRFFDNSLRRNKARRVVRGTKVPEFLWNL
jgi:hypothetical protein